MINKIEPQGLGKAGGWKGEECMFSSNDISNVISLVELMVIHYYAS